MKDEIFTLLEIGMGFSGGSDGKTSAHNSGETQVQSLDWEDPWRRAWQPTPVLLPGESHGQRIPGGLWSMGSKRVGHNLVTNTFASED